MPSPQRAIVQSVRQGALGASLFCGPISHCSPRAESIIESPQEPAELLEECCEELPAGSTCPQLKPGAGASLHGEVPR